MVGRAGRKGLEGPLFVNGASELPPLHWQVGFTYRLRLIDIHKLKHGGFLILRGGRATEVACGGERRGRFA